MKKTLIIILIVFTNFLIAEDNNFKKNEFLKLSSNFYIDSFLYNKNYNIENQIIKYLKNKKKYYYYINHNGIKYKLINIENNQSSYYLKLKNKNNVIYITNNFQEYNNNKNNCKIYLEGIYFSEGLLSFGENVNKFVIEQELNNSYLISNLKIYKDKNSIVTSLKNLNEEEIKLEFIIKDNIIEVYKIPHFFEGEYNHNFIQCNYQIY